LSAQPALGQRLRQERVRRRLSQTALSGDGISASYVSLLESGLREPTRDVVHKLAHRLHVDPALLLHGDERLRSQARMDVAFAKFCLEQGDAGQAEQVLRTLLSSGGPGLDRERLFDARLVLAQAHERLGHLDAAVRSLEDLRLEAQQAPDALPWLPTVMALCRCYRDAGDLGRAVDVAEQAVDLCDRLGLRGLDGHPQLVATMAAAYFDRGDLLRAGSILDELLEATLGADRPARAAANWNAAVVAAEAGRHGEAARLAERAAALLAEGCDERAIARCKITRAWILLADEPPRPEPARALLRSALPTVRQHDSAGTVASAEVELARCELLLGRPEQAQELASRALARLGGEQPLEIARARAVLGEAGLATGDPSARSNLDAAAALLVDVGAGRQAAAIWRRIADARGRAGDAAAALEAYRRALDLVGVRSAAPGNPYALPAAVSVAATDPVGRRGAEPPALAATPTVCVAAEVDVGSDR